MLILTDDDVRDRLTAGTAIAAARESLIAAEQGALLGAPRMRADVGGVSLVFTAGGFDGGPVGFRAYGTWPGHSDQAVLLWHRDGSMLACIVGDELGARRTGALGGVAVDALARSDAGHVAMIGSGTQAWTQLWAISAVRTLESVRIFSTHAAHRERFAERVSTELGVPAWAVGRPREAVRAADIVILATRSERPVVEPEWIEPGTHLNTVGPKTRSAHETPREVVDMAAVVVSDSPAQAAAYEEPFFTSRELVSLGSVLVGSRPGRGSDADITLYCSTGLAGSEIAIAIALVGSSGS